MDVTALILSRTPMRHDIGGVQQACLSGRVFESAADAHAARLDALDLVQTRHFFYLDDDDSLPADYLDVIAECIDTGSGVAYTDELIVDGQRRIACEYSQSMHARHPLLIHHLAVCETALARDVARSLPRGHYWTEMMLYWEMAKRGGAAYVPRIGYHWNKREAGLHRQWHTLLGVANSRAWCMENP